MLVGAGLGEGEMDGDADEDGEGDGDGEGLSVGIGWSSTGPCAVPAQFKLAGVGAGAIVLTGMSSLTRLSMVASQT